MDDKNFDLLIERFGESWRAKVISSPFGDATHQFEFPFPIGDLQSILAHVLGKTRERVKRDDIDADEGAQTPVETFGAELFKAVFDKDVGRAFKFSVEAAKKDGFELRLRLRLGDDELSKLPWEYLYDADGGGFVALSGIPIIRYVELPKPVRNLGARPPLQVLVVAASPKDEPELDIEEEWQILQKALKELEDKNTLKLTRLTKPTFKSLETELSAKKIRKQYHILHFIGHGNLDQESGQGNLIFENEDGNSHSVNSEQLGYILDSHNSLKLVFLNACKGASFKGDPFSSVARALVKKGIPAVVAMQFRITDSSAIILAQRFYQALAEGVDADTALATARRAVYVQDKYEKNFEWGTPVLFMRSPDGQLFDPKPPFSLPRIVLILAIFVLGSVLAFVLAINWPLKLKSDVVGLNQDEAINILEQECWFSPPLSCLDIKSEQAISAVDEELVTNMEPNVGERFRRGSPMKLTVSSGSVEVFHYFHLYQPSRDPGKIVPLIPEDMTKQGDKIFYVLNDLLQTTLRQNGAAEPVLYTWLFMRNTGSSTKCIDIELVQASYKGQYIVIDSNSPINDRRRPLPFFSLPKSIDERTWAFLVHIEESAPSENRPDVFTVEPPENLFFRVNLGLGLPNGNCSQALIDLTNLKSTKIDLDNLFEGN